MSCFNLRIESLVIESEIERAIQQESDRVSISELRVLLLREAQQLALRQRLGMFQSQN